MENNPVMENNPPAPGETAAALADELAPAAAAFLRRRPQAVLATQSLAQPGYPSLSAVPFALAPEGWLAGLFSPLAPHHPNLLADGRCALLVAEDNDGDILTGERLELTCDARRLVDDADVASARDVYIRCYPRADAWFRQLGFHFFRLDVVAARYNGGFGKAAPLAPAALQLVSPLDRAATRRVLDHMNDDHADACAHYWLQAFGTPAEGEVTMAAIDRLGMHLRCGRQLRWVAFPEPLATAADARRVLVAMAQRGQAGEHA
ncbi:MAG: HugZ family protein [Gammaproteobacteria bacterium]